MEKTLAERLREVANNEELVWEVGRKAVEDVLVKMRDAHMFTIRPSGLVINGADGSPSHVIRLGPEHAIKVALLAIADRIEQQEPVH